MIDFVCLEMLLQYNKESEKVRGCIDFWMDEYHKFCCQGVSKVIDVT